MGRKRSVSEVSKGSGNLCPGMFGGKKKEDGSPDAEMKKSVSFFKGQSDKPDVKFQPPHHCFPKCLKEHIPIVMEGMA